MREGGEEGCSSTSSIDFQLAFEKKVVPFDLANSNFLGTIKCRRVSCQDHNLGFLCIFRSFKFFFFPIEKASCLINGFGFFGHALHIWLQFPSLKKRLLLLQFFFVLAILKSYGKLLSKKAPKSSFLQTLLKNSESRDNF